MWKTAFKRFEVIWSAYAGHIGSNVLKAAFQKFYLVHSWIPWPTYKYIYCINVLIAGNDQPTISVTHFAPGTACHNPFSYEKFISNSWYEEVFHCTYNWHPINPAGLLLLCSHKDTWTFTSIFTTNIFESPSSFCFSNVMRYFNRVANFRHWNVFPATR